MLCTWAENCSEGGKRRRVLSLYSNAASRQSNTWNKISRCGWSVAELWDLQCLQCQTTNYLNKHVQSVLCTLYMNRIREDWVERYKPAHIKACKDKNNLIGRTEFLFIFYLVAMFKVFNHNHTTKLYKTFNHLRLTRNTSPSKQILPASKSENICQDLIDSRADLVMSSLNRLHNRHQVTSNKHCSIRSRSIEFIRAVRSLQYSKICALHWLQWS